MPMMRREVDVAVRENREATGTNCGFKEVRDIDRLQQFIPTSTTNEEDRGVAIGRENKHISTPKRDGHAPQVAKTLTGAIQAQCAKPSREYLIGVPQFKQTSL